MARTCTVCNHKDSDNINAMILDNATLKAISSMFGVSKDAIQRHKKHIPKQLVKAKEVQKEIKADSLLERLKYLYAETQTILIEARNEPETALRAIARLEKQIELQAKLLGELQENNVTIKNIYVSPQWVELRSAILKALEPYPEARIALSEALEDIETEL